MWRAFKRHRVSRDRQQQKFLPPLRCTPATVGLTHPSTPAEPEFFPEVRNKGIAAVESGRVAEREDVQSWLIEARIAANARVIVDERTRDQAVGAINVVAAYGIVDAKRTDIYWVEGTACDGKECWAYGFCHGHKKTWIDVAGKSLRKKMRKRKRQIGKLYMLAKNLVKTALGREFRAMHDFHLAQVLKTHGASTAIIDYVAVHGFCLTRVHALQAGAVLREVEVGQASHGPLTNCCCIYLGQLRFFGRPRVLRGSALM